MIVMRIRNARIAIQIREGDNNSHQDKIRFVLKVLLPPIFSNIYREYLNGCFRRHRQTGRRPYRFRFARG